MAVLNKTITNSKTGQSFRFIQTAKSTDGQLLEIESTFSPNSKEPPAHYHPNQVEDFVVLHGELTVRVDSEIKTLRKGDKLHLPANQVHSMWNSSNRLAVVNWKTRPALDSENFYETIIGLANDNKTDNDGRPDILQAALTINKFSHVFRLANPPLIIQRVLFYVLTPIAYLLRKSPLYKKYLD